MNVIPKPIDRMEFERTRALLAETITTAQEAIAKRADTVDTVLAGLYAKRAKREEEDAQIVRYEAEKEALSKLTGAAAVREMLPEVPNATAGAEEPFVPDLPPEALRKVCPKWDVLESGHTIGCLEFASDGTVRWQGSRDWWAVDEKSAIWTGRSFRPHGSTRAHVEALAQQSPPAPPALLDLRSVALDDECEALADIRPAGWVCVVKKGSRFHVVKKVHGEDDVWISSSLDPGSAQWKVAALQPARVVKHACPRCDEGMREIEITESDSWPDGWLVQVGQRFQAKHIDAKVANINAGYTLPRDKYRFVRSDVPPVAEWCKGVE